MGQVSDFGFAKMIEGNVFKPEGNAKFPVRWTAPEAMTKNMCVASFPTGLGNSRPMQVLDQE